MLQQFFSLPVITDNIPVALSQPAATLPLSIFFQLGSPVEEVQKQGLRLGSASVQP